jgi:nitroreductase
MELTDVMRERRSIRAFLPDPVPRDTILEILDEARWAPSWANAQDWEAFAVTGSALGLLKDGLKEAAEARKPPAPDIPMPLMDSWPAEFLARMTYQRPSPDAPPAPPQRPGLWDGYGAPCLLLFTADERLMTDYACFDAGLLVENVCLAAAARGLGTCIMAMLVRWPGVLREVVPAQGKRFVIAVALGTPDPASELNTTERVRVDLGELVHFVD